MGETCCKRPKLAESLQIGGQSQSVTDNCSTPFFQQAHVSFDPICAYAWQYHDSVEHHGSFVVEVLLQMEVTCLLHDYTGADKGVDELYKAWAPKLAADIAQHKAPGILTEGDVRRAQPIVKKPVRASVFGMDVLAPPFPSSAAVLVLALKIIDGLDWSSDSRLEYHWMVQSMVLLCIQNGVSMIEIGQCQSGEMCFAMFA